MRRLTIYTAICIILLPLALQATTYADSCEKVVHTLNQRLAQPIDEQELVDALRSLNRTKNRQLPQKFVTKREAKSQGWRPGRDLWSVSTLKGTSIGGDRFRNAEGRLTEGKWREADLDYKGGHRGGKRLLFSAAGARFVTVDHYRSFVEVPACR